MTQQKPEKSIAQQIGLIAVCFFGVLFIGSIFKQALTPAPGTASVQRFADESKRGLMDYLSMLCNSGNQRACGDLEEMKKQ
jgi:hypothetical protein